MGATGSGKSTFINTLTGSELSIGNSLSSETKDVTPVTYHYRGRKVILIDTPGFDDTYISDTDILRSIASWLEVSYKKQRLLNGILYLHKITENRVTGMSNRNMRLFHKLCGKDAMKNVILCSTMWEIEDRFKARNREKDLLENFWSEMNAQGARCVKHYGTQRSAFQIAGMLVKFPPVTLDIQHSMAEGKSLLETEAGKWVNRELLELQAKHKKEMEELKQELKQAYEEKDTEAQAQTTAELHKLKEEIKRRGEELERLSASLTEEVRALRERLENAQSQRGSCVIA
ncbi:hypothetical protein FRC02_001171 [Tulasnella sp. 418]|nr:hypothetical protein FRC02_001171 [Tulasnella sp. 418]